MALEAHGAHQRRARPRIAGADTRGKVFVLRSDLITAETRGAAVGRGARRAVGPAAAASPTRSSACSPPPTVAPRLPRRAPRRGRWPRPNPELARELEFFNGLGGFAAQGREYVMTATGGQSTPAPWINVIANRGFGFQVASDGGGYTWARNSRENALTPWTNDPVTDRPARLSTCATRKAASCGARRPRRSATKARTTPARTASATAASSSVSHGLSLELTLLVPLDDPVKICRLRVRNDSPRRRSLSVTAYVEWVLGPSRVSGAPHMHHRAGWRDGALLARNPWNQRLSRRGLRRSAAAHRPSSPATAASSSGRHGTLDAPAALVSGGAARRARAGAALDPCAALRARFELEPGASTEFVFLLGEAADADAARALVDALSQRRRRRAARRRCARTGKSSPVTCR